MNTAPVAARPDVAARRPRLAAITATRRLVFAALALLGAGRADVAEAAGQRVRVEGQQLLVDGEPFHIKGVCWNPVPKGGIHPQDLDYRGFVAVDSELMASAGINAVRTYEAINDTEVLDVLWEKGIYVMNTVYSWGGLAEDSAVEKVRAVMHHPAILMWLVGNEWNYNGLYYGLPFEETLAKVSKVVDLIKEVDKGHPVATVHGELPSAETLKALSSVDVWGVNKYSGLTFGDLFDTWSRVSGLPMFLGEYGADAYDARAGLPNETAQAEATTALSDELLSASSAAGRGPCIGGAVFELADEWWKDGTGSPGEHDVGGVSPGGGPWPDMTFNEEWWGLVRYDGTPREAFRAYARSKGGRARRGGGLGAPRAGDAPRLQACGAHRGCRGVLGTCCPAANGTHLECCSGAPAAGGPAEAPGLPGEPEPGAGAETEERPSTTWRPAPCADGEESGSSSNEYVERSDTYVDGHYHVGTDGCEGTGECQFRIRRAAQRFCDGRADCKAVLLQPFGGDCAGGLGCYTPRRGEERAADLWARTGGKAWVKVPGKHGAPCTHSTSGRYFLAGFSRAAGARRVCEQRGGRQASPRSAEERAALQGALDAAQADGKLSQTWPRNTIWLGGEWNASSGRWEWLGGAPVDHFNWAADQPSSKGHQESEPWLCMVLSGETHDSKDEPGNEFGVMCEEEEPQLPSTTAQPEALPGEFDRIADEIARTAARRRAGAAASPPHPATPGADAADARPRPPDAAEPQRPPGENASRPAAVRAAEFPPPPEIPPWRCCAYSYAGATRCREARQLCGPGQRLAMPKTPRESALLQRAVSRAVEAGQLSARWPSNTIWLGGHWRDGDAARWEWDDGTVIDTSKWTPEQLSAKGDQGREPCLAQDLFGVAQDSEPDYTFGVMCEEASEEVVTTQVCATDAPSWVWAGVVVVALCAIAISLRVSGVRLDAPLHEMPQSARLLLLPPMFIGASGTLSLLLGPCGWHGALPHPSAGPLGPLLGSPLTLLLSGLLVPLWVFSSGCTCPSRPRPSSYSVCPGG